MRKHLMLMMVATVFVGATSWVVFTGGQAPLASSAWTVNNCANPFEYTDQVFNPGENVYLAVAGADGTYDVYIYNDLSTYPSNLCNAAALVKNVPNLSGSCNLIWASPTVANAGKYDVIVDDNEDCVFNTGDVIAEAGFGVYAFEITPEATTLILVLAGLGVVAIALRKRT